MFLPLPMAKIALCVTHSPNSRVSYSQAHNHDQASLSFILRFLDTLMRKGSILRELFLC